MILVLRRDIVDEKKDFGHHSSSYRKWDYKSGAYDFELLRIPQENINESPGRELRSKLMIQNWIDNVRLWFRSICDC